MAQLYEPGSELESPGSGILKITVGLFFCPPPGSGSADADVTRYEIENKENMINANDNRLTLFINPPP